MSESHDKLKPSDDASEIQNVERNPAGQIVVKLTGRDEPIVDAKIVRCFPWSMPEEYVSIRDSDGKEIAMLKTPDSLDPESQKIVEEELIDKVFNPRIEKVLDFKHEFGVTSITAQTDRGKVIFQIRNRDDVRVLSATRAIFRDVDGNTYELTDRSALDPTSEKYLQRYF